MSRTHYFTELVEVRRNLIQMGETTALLLAEALATIVSPDAASLSNASELEAKTDHQHRFIHDQCLNLITLQAPVARDARLITGILDAILDLELIGDYAYEVATLSSAMHRRPPSSILSQISAIGAQIQDVLTAAIDAWRGSDRARDFDLRSQQPAIRAECEALFEKLSILTSEPGDATVYVDLMLVSRHLERILRHAMGVAEQGAAAAPFDEAVAI